MIWRWLAALTALPMLGAILFLPEAWPVWLFAWIVLVALGFGR